MTEIFKIRYPDQIALDYERQRIKKLLTGLLLNAGIKEVGSTAIEGVIGKQDIDFGVKVSAENFIETREVLDELFERNPDQISNDIYQGYCVRSTFYVCIQLFIEDAEFDVFEKFLGFLRQNPENIEAYNIFKLAYEGKCMDEYRQAKHEFIQKALA